MLTWHLDTWSLALQKTKLDGAVANITEDEIKAYINTCPTCGKKSSKKTKHQGAIQPIESSSFYDRFQVDLIDYREDAHFDVYNVKMHWLMVGKFCWSAFHSCWKLVNEDTPYEFF